MNKKQILKLKLEKLINGKNKTITRIASGCTGTYEIEYKNNNDKLCYLQADFGKQFSHKMKLKESTLIAFSGALQISGEIK